MQKMCKKTTFSSCPTEQKISPLKQVEVPVLKLDLKVTHEPYNNDNDTATACIKSLPLLLSCVVKNRNVVLLLRQS